MVTPVYAVEALGASFSDGLQKPIEPIQIDVLGEGGDKASLSIELFEDEQHMQRFLEKYRDQVTQDPRTRLTSISLSKTDVHSLDRFQRDIEDEFGVHTIPVTWDPDRKAQWLEGRQQYLDGQKKWRDRETRFLNYFQKDNWFNKLFRSEFYRKYILVGLRTGVNASLTYTVFKLTGEYEYWQAILMSTWLASFSVLDQVFYKYVLAMGIRKGYNPATALGLFGGKKISLEEAKQLPKRSVLGQYEFYAWLDIVILASTTVLGKTLSWFSENDLGQTVDKASAGMAEALESAQQLPSGGLLVGPDANSVSSIFASAGQTMRDQMVYLTSNSADMVSSLCLTNPFLCTGLAALGVGYAATKFSNSLSKFKDHFKRLLWGSVAGADAVGAGVASIAQQAHYDRFAQVAGDRLEHQIVRLDLQGEEYEKAEDAKESFKASLIALSSLVNVPLAHMANLDRGVLEKYGTEWMKYFGYTMLTVLGILGFTVAQTADRRSVLPQWKDIKVKTGQVVQSMADFVGLGKGRKLRQCRAVF